MNEFSSISSGIIHLANTWELILNNLPEKLITIRKNKQQRTIKQILGHMIDSASNNRHRIVYLQYKPGLLQYPNYAINGDNDRWIAIQNYQDANWKELIQLWKYANIHLAHVIQQVDANKLDNKWQYNDEKSISLREMITDYLRHLKLHLNEIDELIQAE